MRALRFMLLVIVLWVVTAIQSTHGPSQWCYDQATWDGLTFNLTGQVVCTEED